MSRANGVKRSESAQWGNGQIRWNHVRMGAEQPRHDQHEDQRNGQRMRHHAPDPEQAETHELHGEPGDRNQRHAERNPQRNLQNQHGLLMMWHMVKVAPRQYAVYRSLTHSRWRSARLTASLIWFRVRHGAHVMAELRDRLK